MQTTYSNTIPMSNIKDVNLEQVQVNNEIFFKISNVDKMRPFFMSIVSAYNHWLFISSNGALTAGRQNSEYALFPYYTDDKITESIETTGSKTIFQIQNLLDENDIWEPFSDRFQGKYNISRNLYKNTFGNKILFEEINHDLELSFQYQWNTSEKYGFVRQSCLKNLSNIVQNISVVDGVQNVLPFGVETNLQAIRSNLVDAYKRTELETESGLGVFALSAIIVDRAEPSEALKANVVYSLGLPQSRKLLSSLQLDFFRNGEKITQEEDVKAEKGAYFINTDLSLDAGEQQEWMLVADVNKNHSNVVELSNTIQNNKNLQEDILEDVFKGTQDLIKITASVDGLQCTSDSKRDSRHFANSMFNAMRGGVFDDNYTIDKDDFVVYFQKANKEAFKENTPFFESLPPQFSVNTLHKLLQLNNNSIVIRLGYEYLPLKFSRRHGDPSRPWNKFSINTQKEDGSKLLDYEGNWRDIFQNWEALLVSYPHFVEGMIYKFLNASTFDGYNPYRVTKDGFDWEVIEPEDPWSYIGYWGDHQIIYLLKFLEFYEKLTPNALEQLYTKEVFAYANVPYAIKAHKEILVNPKDTIVFNESLDAQIRKKRESLGADGALLFTQEGNLVEVNFIEKILATTLAKVSNFIPEVGIWMNTQRPEWNDANNALVGNGVSMVTLYYLRRFLSFFQQQLSTVSLEEVQVSSELYVFFSNVLEALDSHKDLLVNKISNTNRKVILDVLGIAASNYRTLIYSQGFSGDKERLTIKEIKDYVNISLQFLEHSIQANKRSDGMYHAYNLMTASDKEVKVSYLEPMLEGQVAILSSGLLSAKESLEVLNSLKSSSLFREDQYSYLLYPNKSLKGFLQKNTVSKSDVASSSLLSLLIEDGNTSIVERDLNGKIHFNGSLKNADDLKLALDKLPNEYLSFVEKNKIEVLSIYEKVFNHKAFTGRSGTFYGYEGLGSIYWHMVSKLLLAVQEVCQKAIETNESKETIGQLLEHYYEINAGIGVHKSPSLYGAFPTDPYSHTPFGKGAQQPGMTGQVKEDVLSRFGELGVHLHHGKLLFSPEMLREQEFIEQAQKFDYITVAGNQKSIDVEPQELAFTVCQTPIVYKIADDKKLEVFLSNDEVITLNTNSLTKEITEEVFKRSAKVEYIKVYIPKSILK